MEARRSYRDVPNAVLAVLLFLPICVFYGIAGWKLVPVPIEDDYSSMVAFALKWNALHDWQHRLLLVFTNQHNEYKMPLTFGLQSLELSLTHHLHVAAWMWLGNLMALGLLVPLWLACMPRHPLKYRLVAFLPIVWLLMNLGYAEALDFTLTGFQALSALTWSMACILALTRPSWKWNLLAIPMALLACGTNANALLLAPVGFLILVRKRSWVTLFWCIAFAAETAMYFYHYTRIPHPAPGPVSFLRFFFGTAGSSFGFHTYGWPAVLAGVALIALYVFVVRKGSASAHPFAFWAATWLLLTFAMITYGRAGIDPVGFLGSRYKVNCDLFMALLYLQVLQLWSEGRVRIPGLRQLLPVAAVALVLFAAGSDALGWYRFYRRGKDVRYGMTQYLQSNGTVSPMAYRPPLQPWMNRPGIMENARVLLNHAREQGLIEIPTAF